MTKQILITSLLLQILTFTAVTASYNNVTDEYVHHGNLVTIPSDIPRTARKVLLASNAIADFDIFPILPLLVTLSLTNNRLSEFPDLSNVSDSLKLLFLGNNQIRSVDEARLTALTALESLILSGNLLTTIPDVRMPNLATLFINRNEMMATLPVLTLLGRTLISLKLGHPDLGLVSLESLKALPHLRTLSMERSGLSTLPNVVQANPLLANLFLRDNNIHQLPDDLFTNLGNIFRVDLRDNDLQHLPDVCYIQRNPLSL
jgi:Leucine-rich repeat (LRR) protein